MARNPKELTDTEQSMMDSLTGLSNSTATQALAKESGVIVNKTITTPTTDQVKVSANDTTNGYLEDKIVVSDGSNSTNILEQTTLNDGGDEDVQIQIDSSKITTVGTIATGTWEATDVGVEHGGTGVSTLTDGGVLVGSGTGAVTALSVGTNGQVLVGSTGGDPVFATVTDGEAITTTLGAGTLQIDCEDASDSNKGVVELATSTEIDTGTDTTRAIPVDQFVASKRNIRWLSFILVEAGTDCATATNIAGDFVSPIAGTILQSDTTPFYLYATNSTAGTTGTMVVDISINGTSIMTTNKLDFDTTEKTTTTAATPPDLTTTSLSVGDIITIDIDSVHTTAAKGLTVYMAVRE